MNILSINYDSLSLFLISQYRELLKSVLEKVKLKEA